MPVPKSLSPSTLRIPVITGSFETETVVPKSSVFWTLHLRCSQVELIALSGERYVAIEIKFMSSVTDQFKARSYDMMHLKQEFSGRVSGIMVYVHAPGSGISIERARLISYAFDHFFGFNFDELFAEGNKEIADSFLPIIQTVRKFISETT